jgi:hypothetical protein
MESHSNMNRQSGLLRLSILIPCIILLSFAVDVGLRLMPPERVAFRGWEAARAFPTGDGPFAPNVIYRNQRSFGDLANIGNLPSLRHYHSELFTTDKWGFRTTPGQDGISVSVLFAGDSFTAGVGLSDSETLSAQVSSTGHIGTYNGGEVYGTGSWPTIESLIKRLNLKNGLVVYQHSERNEVPDSATLHLPLNVRLARRILPRNSAAYRHLRSTYLFVTGLVHYSPFKIFLTRLFMAFQDDVWLPNVEANKVVLRKLKDDVPFLFLTSEEKNFSKVRDVSTGFFVELKALVRATGNDLLVILVPDKYNVYYPLFQGSDGSLGDRQLYLDLLEKNLKKANVPVLDLTAALREQAAAALVQGKYNYHSDDTHWNALGVSRVAQLILNSRRDFESAAPHN